jgi:hypothetical protein
MTVSATAIIWVISTVVVFVGLVLGRTWRLHRRLRITDLNWKAVAVISVLVAAVPAFIFDQINRDTVDIPEDVDDRASIPSAPEPE